MNQPVRGIYVDDSEYRTGSRNGKPWRTSQPENTRELVLTETSGHHDSPQNPRHWASVWPENNASNTFYVLDSVP